MTDAGTCCDNVMTQNVVPILHEIRHALHKLIDDDESTIIDLRAMPFAPGEEEELEARLGSGEVSIRLTALGPSEIRETSIAGVWLVTHYNDEDEVVSKFIEVTRVPSIILSQTGDIEAGLQSLQQDLQPDS